MSALFNCTVTRDEVILLKRRLYLSIYLSGQNFEAAVKYLSTNSSFVNSHADTAVSLKISDSLLRSLLTEVRPC